MEEVEGDYFLRQSRIIAASLLAYMHRGKFCRRGKCVGHCQIGTVSERWDYVGLQVKIG